MEFTKNVPDRATLLELVDDKVFVSHAVTMATDTYIRESCDGFLFYYMLKENNIIVVDDNIETLKKAMLISSLEEKDITMLLHGCVSRTQGYKIANPTSAETEVEEESEEAKKKREESERLKAEEEEQIAESLGVSIELSKNSMGTVRADKSKDGNDFNLCLPVKLNPNVLVFKGSSTLDEKEFLWDFLRQDAGLTMSLKVPFSILDPVVSEISKRSSDTAEDAVIMAHDAVMNNTITEVVDDPWAALGNMLGL